MIVLVLLKNVGWFALSFFLGLFAIVLVYKLFMVFFGYTWSVRAISVYLDNHGRGNRKEENFRAVCVDAFTRLLWILVFSIIAIVIGCLFLPNLALKVGLIVAVVFFFILIGWIELHYSIRIGRLASIDYEGRVAYFENLDGVEEQDVFSFTYDYDDNREYLRENMKYIVVDFVHYKMFVIADKYEWGSNL